MVYHTLVQKNNWSCEYIYCHNKSAAAAAREEEQLRDLIHLAYKTREQRHLSIITHVYRKRKFKIHILYLNLSMFRQEDLQSLFEPLLIRINTNRKKCEAADKMLAL